MPQDLRIETKGIGQEKWQKWLAKIPAEKCHPHWVAEIRLVDRTVGAPRIMQTPRAKRRPQGATSRTNDNIARKMIGRGMSANSIALNL